VVTTAGSMVLRVIMMPSIPFLVHSVHPEEDIRSRNNAYDTFDHTEAATFSAADMVPSRTTLARASSSRNSTWRPSPCFVALVKHIDPAARHS